MAVATPRLGRLEGAAWRDLATAAWKLLSFCGAPTDTDWRRPEKEDSEACGVTARRAAAARLLFRHPLSADAVGCCANVGRAAVAVPAMTAALS